MDIPLFSKRSIGDPHKLVARLVPRNMRLFSVAISTSYVNLIIYAQHRCGQVYTEYVLMPAQFTYHPDTFVRYHYKMRNAIWVPDGESAWN